MKASSSSQAMLSVTSTCSRWAGTIVAGRDAEDGLDIVVVEEQGFGLVDADGGHLFAFVQAAAYPGADRI